jgi:hypothetical protein
VEVEVDASVRRGVSGRKPLSKAKMYAVAASTAAAKVQNKQQRTTKQAEVHVQNKYRSDTLKSMFFTAADLAKAPEFISTKMRSLNALL